MELRPALEGFAGIPQETRLVFSLLNQLDNIELTGLINHPNRRLWPGLWKGLSTKYIKPYQRAHKLSRVAISVKTDPVGNWWDRVSTYCRKKLSVQNYSFLANLGVGIRIYNFDASDFGDFIWQSVFSKTLPPREYDTIRNARFANVQPSWDMLNKVTMKKMKMPFNRTNRLNSQDYDIFVSQTPFPCSLPSRTQLVVRYHDAIPIFLPHTISNSRVHQYTHMANLVANSKKGLFVCTTYATRCDLLKIFPKLENRSVVIPDIVSHEYYLEVGNPKYVANIIRNNICPETEPKFLTSREKENFYHRNLLSKPLKFLMMVSTIEPRKNHAKLIGAWDYLKNHGMSDLKLVLVGEMGWEYTRIVESMVPWQQRGELFHIHRVPSGQLRILYNAAEAVICPSVAEGFDLSGIEAMLCGGAVVASDIPVHREVYGNSCQYFNPYSTLDQAKAISNVIDPDLQSHRQKLVEAGLKHAPRYQKANIEPLWSDFFEKVQANAFKPAKASIFPRLRWRAVEQPACSSILLPDRTMEESMSHGKLRQTKVESFPV